jgi:uncharacterized membrane protein
MEIRAVWILLLIMVAVVGAFYFLFPRISRRGLLFGVYVGEDNSAGAEASRITRSWYLGMSLWLATAVTLIALGGVIFHSIGVSVVGLSLLPIGFLEEYLRAYRSSCRLARIGSVPPAAAVLAAPDTRSMPLLYLAVGVGLAGGMFSIVYAWSRYSELPAMLATHFGLSGRPDAWRPRSFYSVMLLPIMNLILGAGIAGMAYLIGGAKRAVRRDDGGVSFAAQQRFRRIMASFLALVSMLVTGMLTVLSYSSLQVALKEREALPPALMFLGGAVVLVSLGGSIYIALKYGQGGARLERSAAQHPLTDGLADNRYWILGMFYFNKEDPSLFVERRFGLGYTINFGNPKAAGLAVGFIGLIILIAVLASLIR